MRYVFVAVVSVLLGAAVGYGAAVFMTAPRAPLQRGVAACSEAVGSSPAIVTRSGVPDPHNLRELEALRTENAELKKKFAERSVASEGEAPPKPTRDVPAHVPSDSARELREQLGREPTAEEIAALNEQLARERLDIIETQARLIREKEAAAAAFKAGDVLALLRAARENTPEMKAAVNNPEVFGKWFERKIAGPNMDGSSITDDNPVVDGATVRFGAGKHEWSVSQLGRGGSEFPKDVLIIGAGRDQTLLSIDEFSPESDIRSLTFQDLTLDCADNYLSDIRSATGSTLRFERCRIVRFDMGAGGSVMLYSAGGVAVYATDTLISCGYGRSPGSGNIFRVAGALLVRMERCKIEGPMRRFIEGHKSSSFCFVECAFINVPDLIEAPAKPEAFGATFERCTFAGTEDAEEVQLKLTDINPDWKTD